MSGVPVPQGGGGGGRTRVASETVAISGIAWKRAVRRRLLAPRQPPGHDDGFADVVGDGDSPVSECADIVGDDSDDSEGSGPVIPATAPEAAPAHDAAAASASAPVVDGSAVPSGPVEMRAEDPFKLPDRICGVKTKFIGPHIQQRRSGAAQYHSRIGIPCPNEERKCFKTRSLRLGVEKYGRRAAEAYLHAWGSIAHNMPEVDHRKFAPTHEQMVEALEALPQLP